mmetsp:Transcript_9796/g.30939  ORF Transcript_9796/g.30939 Transcript_9796/m.30939 type:complete len:208 (-) Transcript_9796:133-756(-)
MSASKAANKEVELEKARREKERREFKEAQELESLRRAFRRINKSGSGKITVDDIMVELEFLGCKMRRDEAALMVWEVDDDADGCVDWEELRDMFHRIRRDQSGFEPRKLFNLVEFIMHDKNANGCIDHDEGIATLCGQYGHEFVDQHVAAVFTEENAEKNMRFAKFAKLQQLAARSKNGSGLKPGASMVPQVKGLAAVMDPALSHLL